MESILYHAMLPRGINDGMRKAMCIQEDTVIASRNELVQVFEEISHRLVQVATAARNVDNATVGVTEATDGSDPCAAYYLMDTPGQPSSYGFTAADLTLAALSYPLIQPPEMSPFLLPKPDEYPPEIVELSRQLRSTVAGQHILRMYRDHRPLAIQAMKTTTNEGDHPFGPSRGVVVMKSADIRDRWCFG